MGVQRLSQIFHQGFKKPFPRFSSRALQDSPKGGIFIEVREGLLEVI
jgi:hypothetical protein